MRYWCAHRPGSEKVFQSTHPRGVRHENIDYLYSLINFNPRTHVGCDTRTAADLAAMIFQSTHPRGVRPSVKTATGSFAIFQSTHPRGVRHLYSQLVQSGQRFQSTHPRGVRPVGLHFNPKVKYFNPRTHVGCDVKLEKHVVAGCHISIHAPTWGATVALASFAAKATISIHAPTWGATSARNSLSPFALFQSTHPRGVRRLQ